MRSLYIKLGSIVLIFCLGLIVYSNTFFCSFHFDDYVYVVNNYAIRNFHNLITYWKFYPCRFITFLSILINYHFNQLNVFGYHLFNLAVHLAAAVFVWWLTLLTFCTPAMKEDRITRHAELIALFVGLVFVSHPCPDRSGDLYLAEGRFFGGIVLFGHLMSLCSSEISE